MNKLSVAAVAALALAACTNKPKLEPVPDPPVIDHFTATPATVAVGDLAHLDWQTHGATQVKLVQVGGTAPDVGGQVNGSVDVKITEASLFVLSAFNSRGVKATAVVSVGVEGGGRPGIFAALPTQIAQGGTSTLAWSFPGAASLALVEVGGAPLDLSGKGDTGSLEVQPSKSTTYQLTVDGVASTAEVKVGAALVNFTVSKGYGLPGDTVTLSWQTALAAKVTLLSPGRGALVEVTDPTMTASGSFDDTLPALGLGAVVPYTLRVEGDGPMVEQTITVYLGNAPSVKTFTAPHYALTGGQFTLAWETLNADVVELSTQGTVFWRSGTAAEAQSGSLQLDTPQALTDYTLVARSSRGGGSDSQTQSVDPVGTVTVNGFTLAPSPVANGGDAATLTWDVPNARHLVVTGSDGFTVATAHGATAVSGTATVYPNGPITYTLSADNTLEAPVTATADGDATTPAAFGPASSGAIFQGNPLDLTWSVGGGSAPLQGFASATVQPVSASTGFVDISQTGTVLGFTSTDDSTLSFTPEDFETFLYGNRLSGNVVASTNGFFVFGTSASSRATTVAIPNTTIERNFVAPYWANLELGTGHVYWEVVGEAPERTLVVQYDHVRVKGDATSDLVFEAKVHQTGVVTFEYQKLQFATAPTHVIGVQGPVDGVSSGGEAAGGALVFFGPQAAPVPFTFSAPATVGGFIALANGYLRASYTPAQVITTRDLAISEAMFSPAPAIASTGEWFEVTNLGGVPLDLGGWTIDFGAAGTHTIAGTLPLGAGATVVLGQTEADAGNDDVATQYQYGEAFTMDDAAGSLSLRNQNFAVSAAWGTLDGGTDAGTSVNFDPPVYLVAGDTSTTAFHSISCNSTAPFGSQVPQQLGTPGVQASCFGYQLSSIPVDFEDVSATGTPLYSATWDETYLAVTLSTAFPYFGTPRTTATVSTNGWVGFLTYTSASLSNKTVPSTSAAKGVMGIFWDDLAHASAFGAASQVYQQRMSDHTVFQWAHATHYLANDDLNFEVKLFDDGHFEYHYATMTSGSSSNYANGNGATIWVENEAGNTALVIGNNKPVIRPNTAFRFTPR